MEKSAKGKGKGSEKTLKTPKRKAAREEPIPLVIPSFSWLAQLSLVIWVLSVCGLVGFYWRGDLFESFLPELRTAGNVVKLGQESPNDAGQINKNSIKVRGEIEESGEHYGESDLDSIDNGMKNGGNNLRPEEHRKEGNVGGRTESLEAEREQCASKERRTLERELQEEEFLMANDKKDGEQQQKDVSVDGKRRKEERKSLEQKTHQNIKVSAKETTKNAKVTPRGKVKEDRDGAMASKKKNEDIPKEIREFKRTFLKTLRAKKIFADGRRIPPIELIPQKPNNSSVRVYLFNEFLSNEECDGLMRAHNNHVAQMNQVDPLLCFDSIATLRKHLEAVRRGRAVVSPPDFTQGTTCINASFSRKLKQWLHGNWSYSTAFYPGESRFSKIFEHRVKQATELTPENGGKFQITSYPLGVGYKSHTDCMVGSQDKRDRMATVLVYLQDVAEGGETRFPELGIWVKPRKGRALVWNNMDEGGKCEPLSVHEASKVNSGHKYIFQRWYYYESFYSLGKRPPEPSLPNREIRQARVSCDEYDHGSCRWYDEWNYDHLLSNRNHRQILI